jgi:hypothetical protein
MQCIKWLRKQLNILDGEEAVIELIKMGKIILGFRVSRYTLKGMMYLHLLHGDDAIKNEILVNSNREIWHKHNCIEKYMPWLYNKGKMPK